LLIKKLEIRPKIVLLVLKVDKTIVVLAFSISNKNSEGRNRSVVFLHKLGFKKLILEKKLGQKRS
jgi:hypothetical protein